MKTESPRSEQGRTSANLYGWYRLASSFEGRPLQHRQTGRVGASLCPLRFEMKVELGKGDRLPDGAVRRFASSTNGFT